MFIGAADKVGESRRGTVDVHPAAEADRPEGAGLRTGCGVDLLGAGHAQRIGDPGQLLRLDGVQLMIAADHQRNHAAVAAVDQQRLDGLFGADAEQRAEVGNRAYFRRRDARERLGRRRARPRIRRRGGHLEVRGIAVGVREHDRVLAGVGQHMEFLRGAAADAAAVGLHRAELQSKAREDAYIGLVHGPIAFAQAGLVDVERIRVLHQELAGAHHAKARPDLVAELELYLVEIHRQLLVAAQLAPRDVGDHFLVGRSVREFPVMTVPEAQQFGAVLGPAAGFLPQLRRLDRRHAQLQGAGPVHLLADDALDLLQRAQAERHPRVQARGEAADQTRPQHELVTDDLRVGGYFLDGRNRVSG